MNQMSTNRSIRITETILRDGQQSLLATRMKTSDMLPVAEAMDELGFYSVEVWGGATFDSAMRFLSEDPWDRLRQLKKAFKKTPLQMLLRGQNLVGYRHYADDVVEAFVERAVDNGIDIFRIFDALNDTRNMEAPFKAVQKAGGHIQGAVVYTTSPVHDLDHFVNTARKLADMGANSLCIKDMAGLLTPRAAFELVSRIKAEISLPLHIHSHFSNGLCGMSYLKAIEAGADGIDTSLSALAYGSAPPASEIMAVALQDAGYETGLDLQGLIKVNRHFKDVRTKYSQFLAPFSVDGEALSYQIPGGMLSNLRAQLGGSGMLNRLPEVLNEVPAVRAELGYPPLVTPMSQIVATQAVMNVITGKRYSVRPAEVKNYVLGRYGRSPAPIDSELRKTILEGEDPGTLDVRPADLLKPELPAARQALKGIHHTEEDVISYALFPEYAMPIIHAKAEANAGQLVAPV